MCDQKKNTSSSRVIGGPRSECSELSQKERSTVIKAVSIIKIEFQINVDSLKKKYFSAASKYYAVIEGRCKIETVNKDSPVGLCHNAY